MDFSRATISAPFGCRAWRCGGQRPQGAAGRRRRVGSAAGASAHWRSWKVRCVATKKHKEKAAVGWGVEFADEEDYVKGGDGELLYVQMQATKAMDS